jgi:large subunit ribosomal protein L25
MEKTTLRVRSREAIGTRAARRVRRSGDIPGVLYGGGEESLPIAINERELRTLISEGLTENTLINLLIDDEKKSDRVILIRDVQRDPVRGDFTHIDMVHIDLEQEIEVEVPILLIGTPEGVKMGGILEQRLHDLEISCLPGDIPESFEIDVSELMIGDAVHVSDLETGRFEVITEQERTIASVAAPRILEEEEEEEEEVVLGEPALVGEEEEEGEEVEEGEEE